MTGNLTDVQIDRVLNSNLVGRIGCSQNNKIYIIPVTYVYYTGYIYVQSKEGKKVEIMRKNPSVCFQVDDINDMNNWRSVLVWGDYEELKAGAEQQEGRKIIEERLTPYRLSESISPIDRHSHPPQVVEKELKAVAYRIKILEKSGRYEKT